MQPLRSFALLILSTFTAPGSAEPPPVHRDNDSGSWVSVEFHRGLILLPTEINGVEVTAILDSGAGLTCVSSALAAELELGSGMAALAQGTVGATVPAAIHQGLRIDVAGVTLEDAAVVAIDLAEVERHLGRALPVILGQNLFEQFVVDIDYPNARVAFRDVKDFEYDGPGERLPLYRTADGLRATELSIEGHEPVQFMIDTGLVGTVDIAGSYAREKDLLGAGKLVSTRLGGGVGGVDEADVATLRALSVGDVELANVPAAFDRDPAAGPVMGSVGSDVLQRFRVIFFPKRDLFVAEPSAAAVPEPFRKDTIGLQTLLDDESLLVIYVNPGSPAASAGWKKGERIVEIDGVRASPETGHEWTRLVPGTRATLLDGEGRERVLVAAEYF